MNGTVTLRREGGSLAVEEVAEQYGDTLRRLAQQFRPRANRAVQSVNTSPMRHP